MTQLGLFCLAVLRYRVAVDIVEDDDMSCYCDYDVCTVLKFICTILSITVACMFIYVQLKPMEKRSFADVGVQVTPTT